MRVQNCENNLTSLREMLDARENRVIRQKTWLEQWRAPIVSLTLVSPGPEKYNDRYVLCMNEAIKTANALFGFLDYYINDYDVFWLPSGPEAIWSISCDPDKLKQHLVSLEEVHQLGRLWDFDVITPGNGGISRRHYGLGARKCLICDDLAYVCARSRKHPVSELTTRIEGIIDEFTYAQ